MNCKQKFLGLFPAWLAVSALCLFAAPVGAVVIVGGDNGWEVSFDGNVNGFWVYEDVDDRVEPSVAGIDAAGAACADPSVDGCTETAISYNYTGLSLLSLGERGSRVRTGLLPAFFSFNVVAPEINGLRGSARISFAPQIQNANTKNAFGAQVDLREVFFNVDGDFGTLSVGRTLSLFQRQNIVNDMTLFGVGVQGSIGGGGTTLGRIGYGYVYPQFNGRISYKTANVSGFQMEVGMYDPSKICGLDSGCATTTKTPRFETELTYATSYDSGSLLGWFGAMWQDAEGGAVGDVTAWGVTGGLNLSAGGFGLVAAAYTGEALGTTLMLDIDSLDEAGNEYENDGFYVQGTYSIGSLKLGVSYGENNSDPSAADSADCTAGNPCIVDAPITELSALTFGAYYDVNSWFKLVTEYTRTTNTWQETLTGSDIEVDGDLFTVGSFFTW